MAGISVAFILMNDLIKTYILLIILSICFMLMAV